MPCFNERRSSFMCIGGGTKRAPGARTPPPPPPPPLVRICLLVPPFKLSGMVTFLTILRRWNTCSDGSAIPEHGKRHSKNTRARYSSGIKSKYKFQCKYGLRSNLRTPNFINFLGEHAPRPPSVCVLMHASSSVPPNHKYLPLPMMCRSREGAGSWESLW